MNIDDIVTATAPGADPALTEPDAPKVSPEQLEKKIAELAKLKPMEYELRREAEAKALGVRVSFLDKQVAAQHAARDDGIAEGIVEEINPWPHAVDGLGVAETIRSTLLRHVIFPGPADADAATLWIFGTYMMDVWRLWPKLLIVSPEKRCGKSTLLEVIEAHVARGMMTANITAPALFRAIEKWSPTLLIDEADRFLKSNEEANGVINAGHTRRTAYVMRCVEQNGEHGVRRFSVWAPQVIASIGSQFDTLEDRSIRIGLRRRLPSETVEKMPSNLFEARRNLRRRLARWTQDNTDRIRRIEATPPACGNDRAQDNWEPLFRIAAILGGPWPDRVATGYELKEVASGAREETASVMLLRDVWALFEEKGADQLQSADVVAWLNDREDRPWAEWKGGKPITTQTIGRLLKPFGVAPKQYKLSGQNRRGYLST